MNRRMTFVTTKHKCEMFGVTKHNEYIVCNVVSDTHLQMTNIYI